MIAVVDANSAIRGWIATAIGCRGQAVVELEWGWQLLGHLAEHPTELVVAGNKIPDVPGLGLLAMARTAGLDTPFLLIVPFCRGSVRAAVKRLGGAEIIEDWSDTCALRSIVERFSRPRLETPRFGERRAATAHPTPRLLS